MKTGCKSIAIIIIFIMLVCSACTDKQPASDIASIQRENMPTSEGSKGKGDEGYQYVLYNFSLIDGTGAELKDNMMIFVKKDRIEKIVRRDKASMPEGYQEIDLKGYVVLPGFINTHVHCFYSEQALQQWLENGVTTVRELAAPKGSDLSSTRDASNQNSLNARVATATPFITTTGGYIPPFVEYVDTPEEAADITKSYLKMNPDVIKISIEDDLQGKQWTLLPLDLIQSITRTAHEGNKKVAAHISHVRNLHLAIDGGVDELSHMVVEPLDEELAKEIAEKGIYWVPTLELWQRVSEKHDLTWDQTAIQNLSVFFEAGGKIALGTDYGGYSVSFDGGMPMAEIKAMKAAGMSNMDIIISATQNAATVCGMESQIGTLEEGKIADLIVVKENPLEDLEALTKLHMVIHNGNIITSKYK